MKQARIHSINVSRGGVPKTSVPCTQVSVEGCDGDAQRHLQYHGGPHRAVSIYSLELIEQLQQEGHPIAPGTIGENLTLTGLDWLDVASGVILAAEAVVLEVTTLAFPCKTIVGSFRDGDFRRVSEKLHPGWSRWYCRVLSGGMLAPGMTIAIQRQPALPLSPTHE